ncbi:MAG: HD domain-containing protein [Nitrososphaeria archaeon]
MELLEIKDPVHGYIKLTELEQNIIDTNEFQRLRRIRQLSGAHFAYPTAMHTRFCHSLGVLHLAGYIGDLFISKKILLKDDVQKIRVAALLHDVGHGPFSHLFEEVIYSKRNITHEDLTKRVIKETIIRDILENYGISSQNISDLSIGQSKMDPAFMNEIIGGGLSVDIMDYILRDAYFTGVEYGKIDINRLLNSFDVCEKDDRLALDHAAIYSLESMMFSRYEMFKAVYFHKTVRAAEIMLVHALSLADEVLNFSDLKKISDLVNLDDESIIYKILSSNDPKLKDSQSLIQNVLNRKLIKCVYEKVVHRKDPLVYQILTQKDVRDTLIHSISSKANVPERSIYVDVPTAPSLPVSSKRESLVDICVFTRTNKGKNFWTIPFQENVVLNAIHGYVDLLRIYATAEYRKKVEAVVDKIFGTSHDFISKLSV